MGDSLMLVDMTGRIVFANQATTEMLGYSVREMYGRTLHSLFTGPGPQGLDEQSFISTLISHKKIKDINVLYVAKDGKTVPVLFSASLAERDEVPVGVVVTAHDMTSYMEIAENLRLSEERYRTLVENALVGIGIHQDNKTVYANPVLVEMLGYTADEVIGLPIAQIIAPEERDLVLTRAKRRQEGKDEPVIYEITLIRKDGAPLYALISNVVINYNGTKATMFTISDITDTKARRELEMANRELEAFSYSVSHDLRAPLRAIHGFAEALIEDYGDRLDEVGMDYLNRVRRSAERMAQLIDGLLSLSRLSQRDLYVGMVDLSTVAREVIEELSQRQPDRSVEVKIADGLVAECDVDLVRIVLDNLLGNSWKFTVGKDQAVIEFGAIGQNGETVYFVRDNGVGFDMRYADKLFMPFQRLHGEEFEGTGIGLATVARIIYRHGGRIWAEGVPGAGATFFFTLSEPGRESNGRKKNSA
jgi:PAS domain S-box-containing protein